MIKNYKILPHGVYFIKGDELDFRRRQRNGLIRLHKKILSIIDELETNLIADILKYKHYDGDR